MFLHNIYSSEKSVYIASFTHFSCDALQLEWENDKDEYLEMEILEDVVNVFQIDSDGNEVQKIMEFDSETINKVVREFYDRAV